jgi:hypothetical protein
MNIKNDSRNNRKYDTFLYKNAIVIYYKTIKNFFTDILQRRKIWTEITLYRDVLLLYGL